MLKFNYTQQDVNRWIAKGILYWFGGIAMFSAFAGVYALFDYYHYTPLTVERVEQHPISVRELAEHFNACVQSYTRTAHPISMEKAEQRCSCAGDYLVIHGYGDTSFKNAQKACGMEMVSK